MHKKHIIRQEIVKRFNIDLPKLVCTINQLRGKYQLYLKKYILWKRHILGLLYVDVSMSMCAFVYIHGFFKTYTN